MKKFILVLLIFIIIIAGCQQSSEPKTQITVCNTAHEAGTCDTRLAELGIVLKEDCCRVLGKCC